MTTETAREFSFADIGVGSTAAFEHSVSTEDVDAFAAVSGDYSPLHVDERYATSTSFGQRVVHGMFLGALVSRLIGMYLPGAHALILKETLEFKKPVFIGDTVTIEGIVSSASTSTRIIQVEIKIQVGNMTAVTGSVLVQVRE